MCDECHQSPHATMCPNNPALADDDPIMKRCPICEREFDEEEMTWSVCDECLEKNATDENAMAYGEVDTHRTWVKINSYVAWHYSESEINEILKHIFVEHIYLAGVDEKNEDPQGFCEEDDGAFADWLKEQKGEE